MVPGVFTGNVPLIFKCFTGEFFLWFSPHLIVPLCTRLTLVAKIKMISWDFHQHCLVPFLD